MVDISLIVGNLPISVPAGATIMEATEQADIRVPLLCHHPSLGIQSSCRVRLVEVEGARDLDASCRYPAAEGMVVHAAIAPGLVRSPAVQ